MVNENYSQVDEEQQVEENETVEEVNESSEESVNTKENNELAAKQTEIDELQAKLDDANNRLLRAQADFDNFRRRTNLDKEAAQKYRAQSLIEEILPALDNFERALAVEDSEDNSSLKKGMEMVYRQLQGALTKEGLEVIEAKGQEFDPNFHQAVMQVEEEGYESNVVVDELQKGYKLKDRVIRPAMVKVNQ